MAGETTKQTKQEFTSRTRRLKLGIALGLALVAGEATIGILTKSLALISDAAHNASDILAMGLALFAVYMMSRDPTPKRSFGYGRVGILTALANCVVLITVAGVLCYEAIYRIAHIRPVSGSAIFIAAGVCFIINSTTALILYSHRHDLNIRSAFLHMAADAGVSISVVVAGIIIVITKWYYADPVIALVVSLFIFYATWGIIRDATDILLESVPRNIDIDQVQKMMESLPGVDAVHHLHIWELGSGVYALSGHVEVEDRYLSECSQIIEQLNQELRDRFNIIHPTVQVECSTQCPSTTGGPES